MKALNIIVGIGAVGLGIVAYPYYMEFLVQPLIDLAQTMRPGMSLWDSAFLGILPFVSLVLIFWCGAMYALGKVGWMQHHGDDYHDYTDYN